MYDTGENKEKIVEYLAECKEECEISDYSWGEETLEIMFDLVKKGKMVRGSLLIDAAEVMGGSDNAIHYAAATELVHTGLLVHDDIIDRDGKRRGMDSVHIRFRSEEVTERQAYNLAICAGDISYFTAFKMLSKTGEANLEALSEFSSTFARVGIGEMSDIALSRDSGNMEEEILDIYRNKTACYTFSLPLKIASLLAEGPELDKLHKIGMKMGVLYQIKDDHLDIFSELEETGKPVASDIREGKKTLHTEILKRKTSTGEEIYEQKSDEEVLEIVDKMKEAGVREEVDERIQARKRELLEEINGLENQELKQLLEEVLELVVEREK